MPIILIHGAYHGGWCWKKTVSILLKKGVEVYTPTLTGLGDRNHLLTSDVNLSTHISDIVEFLRFEDLKEVELIGHSYAGFVISGVADIVPQRIARLTYLDALVPSNGQTVFDILPGTKIRSKEISLLSRKIKVITPPSPQAFGVNCSADIAWMKPRLTPMPYQCYAEPIQLINKTINSIAKRYFMCKIQIKGELHASHESAYEMAQKSGWTRKKLTGTHDIMVTHPEELVNNLLEKS